ncbi:MAG: cation:proton antiporter [Halobacteria archaeon]|nr:cation:proton antiporter [Halobacteria archaeon]
MFVEPIGREALFLLFLQLFIILLVAWILGRIATRFGLAPVVGELMTGIVLGPSLLGVVAPGVFQHLFPPTAEQYHLIEAVSWVGLLMLLTLTGLETDLGFVRRHLRSSASVSVGGIVLPFVFGLGFAYLVPDYLLVNAESRFIFSLFIATAMSISAIPVIARILIDIGAIRSEMGQLTLAGAMVNDTAGWILLSLVAGLAHRGVIDLASVLIILASLIGFVVVSLTVGQSFVTRLMRSLKSEPKISETGTSAIGISQLNPVRAQILAIMILAMGAGTLTHYMSLEAILGAFVVGVLVSESDEFEESAKNSFETVTIGVFAPIFFGTAGLRVDLTTVLDPQVAFVGIIALLIAVVGKFVGSYLGAMFSGIRRWDAIGIGAGLNARGAMEIVIATVGLELGILTIEMYSIIVMIAIVTSVMASPVLKWSFSKSRNQQL